MAWYRNPTYPLILAIICAVIVFIAFYYPGTPLDSVSASLTNWVVVITNTMVWVGLINVARYSVRESIRRTPGRWYLAIFQLVLMAVLLIVGFAEGSRSTARGADTITNWFYNNYYQYSALASSALSGLWCISATYRAFRVRNFESFLFMLGAVFVLMNNAPIGGIWWQGFPVIGSWIMDSPYTAMMRVLSLGTGIGIMAYAVRFFIGRQREAFGGGE
jgi:hypothetical protein